MNAINDIRKAVDSMTKVSQAPGYIPSSTYYPRDFPSQAKKVLPYLLKPFPTPRKMKRLYSSLPERWKDHALNMAVEGERGWWKFFNNVIPDTPVYLSQLIGGTLGGIKGAYGSSPSKHNNLESLARKPGLPGAIARASKYTGYLKDVIEEAYQGAEAGDTIAREYWQKPARKWQDILYPYLSEMDAKTKDLSSQLEELRKRQYDEGNPDALEDFRAAQKMEHIVPFTAASAVLGKTTSGFGTLGNSK